MIILKNFRVYESKTIGTNSFLFLEDENQDDWYESQNLFSEGTLKIVFAGNGVIVSMSNDVSALWPVGNSVAEIEASKVPEGVGIDGDWVFNGKEIIKRVFTSEELTEQATIKRDSLMSEASTAIAPLQDAVDIGDATEEETALLKEWKQYRVALNRLDLSNATAIVWPEQPKV